MHEPVKKYQLKEGQLKHLMGDLGRLASTLTTETKIYEQAQPGDRSLVNLTSERRAPDLVLFNFKSPNFTNAVLDAGLTVSKPPKVSDDTAAWCDQVAPWLSVWRFGTAAAPAENLAELERATEAIRRRGRFFAVEVPRFMWRFAVFNQTAQQNGDFWIYFREVKWWTNSPEIRQRLRAIPDSSGQGYKEHVRKALQEGLTAEHRKRRDNRFMAPVPDPLASEVFFVGPSQDVSSWRDALQVAKTWMGRRLGSLWVPKDHRLHALVSELVPWDINRTQVATLPKRRRFPLDIGHYKHRACILSLTRGDVEIIAEAIQDISSTSESFTSS